MCNICMKTTGFRGACPPNHCVRNVSRASSFPSAGHPRGSLDHSLGNLGTPWPPKGFSIIIIHSSIHASIPPFMFFLTSHRASGVGGSAMHMKCPDDIGREAGIGRTQDWKELKVFRASTGRSGSAPSEIIVECYCYSKNIVVEPPGPATVTGTRD